MLEHLNNQFRIMEQQPPSRAGLIKLRAERELPQQVVELYEEISKADIQGVGPRYFRFWSPERVLEIDIAYNVSASLPRSLPIGSDGGGNLIVVRDARVFSVSYGALAEEELSPLANSLAEFLENPEPLWPWANE